MNLVYRNDSDIVKQLIAQDPQLETIFKHTEEIVVPISSNYFASLLSMILAQQLSGKVASIIIQRFETFLEHDLTPNRILAAEDEALRGLGLSRQKISYVKSLATCVQEKTLHFDDIQSMSDDAIIEMLVKVKGIGRWTAEMFLMFSMGRENVFSVLDLGLRNAVKRLYNQDLSNEEINHLSEKWSPYKSIVSHFLWHSWDMK